jgi:glycogen operon protein
VFHRRDFFGGGDGDGSGLPDIRWFRADGREMSRRDWRNPELRNLGVFLNGEELPNPGPAGEPVVDDSFVLLVNASPEEIGFRLPARRFGNRWLLVVTTADPEASEGSQAFAARAELRLPARSMVLLRRSW